MNDFMENLERAYHDRVYNSLDVFPDLIVKTQTAERKAVNEDPMLFANLVQQRPLQNLPAPLPQEEREKKKEPVWVGFLCGLLTGAATGVLLTMGVLI